MAYGVVALFGLAYLLVSVLWSDLTAGTTVVVSVLVAAPLALGLLWPRLTGFKAFGFEVTLARVTVQPDARLAATIMAPDLGSTNHELVRQMKAITQPGVELLELNLQDGNYWWSTRLYLLAALAHEMSEVGALVFLSGGDDRRFVGLAAPSAVRRALAARTPELETTYLKLAQSAPVADAKTRVGQIIDSWTAQNFGPRPSLPEESFTNRVSAEGLRVDLAAIGLRLRKDSIDWPGYTSRPIVRALIHEFEGDYVALLRSGSFDRVVKRTALAMDLAARVT